MGVWSYEVLTNDTALDLMDDLKDLRMAAIASVQYVFDRESMTDHGGWIGTAIEDRLKMLQKIKIRLLQNNK